MVCREMKFEKYWKISQKLTFFAIKYFFLISDAVNHIHFLLIKRSSVVPSLTASSVLTTLVLSKEQTFWLNQTVLLACCSVGENFQSQVAYLYLQS